MAVTSTSTSASPNRLTNTIMIALLLGIAVGYACNTLAPSPEAARTIASYFSIITDIFLRMIKMIVAPLVFATIVSGISSLGSDGGAVGRIAAKSMGWFISASLISLSLGMLFANLFAPGKGLGLPLPSVTAATNLPTGGLNLKDFITHVFPTSAVQAMATNEVLQILVCESASTRDPAKTQLRLSSSCENQDQGGVTIGADRDPTLMKDFAYISM